MAVAVGNVGLPVWLKIQQSTGDLLIPELLGWPIRGYGVEMLLVSPMDTSQNPLTVTCGSLT